jgi:hypothetical protein
MTFLKWMTFVVLFAFAGGAAAEPNVLIYSGVARSPRGELLYRERHEVTESSGRPVRAVTRYFDPKGREIARLESDFSRSATAPNYRLHVESSGQEESAAVSGANLLLDYRGKHKTLEVKGAEPLVIGQGLHEFVRSNLERLASETVTVRLAVLSRLDTYKFRIRPLPPPAPGVVRLRVEIDDFVLRQLAPHLEFDYELTTRHLLRYSGVSNLEAADGSRAAVEIQYSYVPASP